MRNIAPRFAPLRSTSADTRAECAADSLTDDVLYIQHYGWHCRIPDALTIRSSSAQANVTCLRFILILPQISRHFNIPILAHIDDMSQGSGSTAVPEGYVVRRGKRVHNPEQAPLTRRLADVAGSQIIADWPQSLLMVKPGVSWMNSNSVPYWISTSDIIWSAWGGKQYMKYKKRREPTAKYVKFKANNTMDPVYVASDSDAYRFICAGERDMRIVNADSARGLDFYTILPAWQVKWTDYKKARDRSRSREARARQSTQTAT